MAYNPNNPNGQAVKASSAPFVLSTEQEAIITGLGKTNYGTAVQLGVSALSYLNSDSQNGWKSELISNLSLKVKDYQIGISLETSNDSPTGDTHVNVYIIPFWTPDSGSTWYGASGGNILTPDIYENIFTIDPINQFKLAISMKFNYAQMPLQDTFLLSSIFGDTMPQGFELFLLNQSGAIIQTNNLIYYIPIH